MSDFFKNSRVKQLTPTDFDKSELTKIPSIKCGAVLFYASYCHWCVAVKPTWEKLADSVMFMDIAAFECDSYPEHTAGMNEDMNGFIPSYPTMVLYKNGKPVRKVGQTDRDYTTFLNEFNNFCT